MTTSAANSKQTPTEGKQRPAPRGRTDFSERLKAAPGRPGVYTMRGRDGGVLYVGKASSLRNRLRSYFQNPLGLEPKIRRMVERVADFEFVVTDTESEALILENTLIKRHQPPFNARLKDDKTYPYIKIDVTEDFPQVYFTRKISKDGSKYFGPFASASSVRRTLALLKRLFPYRSCTKTITGNDPRPCLEYHIKRCLAPCTGEIDKDEYREIIDQVTLFLDGRTSQVVRGLNRHMRTAASELKFERAAALRDQLQAVEKVLEGQKVFHLTSETTDVIALSPAYGETWVEVFFIRQGKLIGRDHFIMAGTDDEDPAKAVTAFVKQFYDANPYVPRLILVQHNIEGVELIEDWLREKRGSRVEIRVPQRGEKRKLLEMVAQNAAEGVEQLKIKQSEGTNPDSAMEEVQEALGLPRLPRRIECYDISNIQGSNPVGSMVVFQDGKSSNSNYRRFKIKSVEGVDDYAMMAEMLTRRFKRLAAEGRDADAQAEEATATQAWRRVPDLVLIDGGKGHLGTAVQVMLDLGIDYIPLASIAKENEEIFVPHMPEPVVLPRTSQGLFLMQRVRDEAHRFAITFHRERRSKRTVQSSLDLVPGIGPKRRRMLLRRFGSVKAIQEAPLVDIAAVPGLTMRTARRIKEYL